MYVLFLFIMCEHRKKNKFTLEHRAWNKRTVGEKKYIIQFAIGAVIWSVVCWGIPLFWNEENFAIRILKVYLQYELVIAIAIFLFLCTSLLTEKNREKQVEMANRIVRFLLPISVGANLFARQIILCYWPNWIVLGFLSVFYYSLLTFDIKKIEDEEKIKGKDSDINYNPVEEVEQLFPQHQAQAKRIADIIKNSTSEPFSICLSGKWGTGKTSVINGVAQLLVEVDNYEIIRINALEVDTKETLLNYFMSEVKRCLKQRGVYVGITSEYKEFVASMVGTVTTESLGMFLQNKIFGMPKDYRKQKKELEKILSTVLEKGKMVLVVDDIERCQEDIAREYLFLIKEVATMKNCVSIFVTDYDILSKVFNKDENEFLEKFFNYRVNLYDEEPEEVFAFFDEELSEKDVLFADIYRKEKGILEAWYRQSIEEIDKLIQNQEITMTVIRGRDNNEGQETKLKMMRENREIFISYIKNPRCVVKLYNIYKNNMQRCYEELFGGETKEEDRNIAYEYIRTRNIKRIISFLSFVEVCLPDELQQIIENGADYIEEDLGEGRSKNSKERNFIIDFACATVYEEYDAYEKKTNYIKVEMRRFIDGFLKPNTKLKELIKPFTTREEEWITSIEKGDEKEIALNWNEMVHTVLKIEVKEHRLNMFETLLKHAERKIEVGIWTIDKLFSIFEDDTRGRLFSEALGMMYIFEKYLQKIKSATIISDKRVNNMLEYARYYSFQRVASTNVLLQFLHTGEGGAGIGDISEIMLNSTQTLEENLIQFLDESVVYLSGFQYMKEGWGEKYQELSEEIGRRLKDKNLLKYIDVREKAEHMMDSVNELFCLNKILEWICVRSDRLNKDDLSDRDYLQVEKMIQYFKDKIANTTQELDIKVEREFKDFFIYIKNSEEVQLSEEQIEQLQDLITCCVGKKGNDSLFYRKILLEISNDSKRRI